MLKQIQITEIENIRIGHAQDVENATGCTVIICEKGAPAGVDVRAAVLLPVKQNYSVLLQTVLEFTPFF